MLVLLQAMLEFNPHDRMSAKHIIASPSLTSIQDSWIVNNGYSLASVLQRPMNFDYEHQRNVNLKPLIFKEIQGYSSNGDSHLRAAGSDEQIELKPREGATSL